MELLEQQEWLEPVETGLQEAVGAVYKSTGSTGQAVKNFLHGTWLGHPLHPALTDIPLGAWTAALVLDIADDPAADVALELGLAGSAFAAAAGLTDWQATDGAARRTGVVHGLLNIASVGFYTASLICRKQDDRSAGKTLAAIGFAISAVSAYLGGNLVYRHRIGVDHTDREQSPENWTPVLDDSQLLENQPRRVEAMGYRVLLVRLDGRIHAISEVCSHLGGPLSEGALEGKTVQCPWHGSRFSIEDGHVIDGPATHPQACFEARVRDGKIEVRARH